MVGQDDGQTDGSEGGSRDSPIPHARTTKAVCESVAHILQSLTDQEERATVVSIDGCVRPDISQRDVGRSRHGPRRRQVVATLATFLRIPVSVPLEDGTGETHWIPQGEGGGGTG